MENLKVCLISSHGGHFHELLQATDCIVGDCYYVTYRTAHTVNSLSSERHYFIIDPHTSKLKYVVNALQSFWHLFTERPKVIISTGAGIAIPSLLFGKYLLKSKIIFIESAANVDHPSKTARFMYNHSDLFLVQWKPMLKTFPSATWVGVL